MQLYDLNKKGTIIVGQQRSGTQHLLKLVETSLVKNKIEKTNNGEYFNDVFDKKICKNSNDKKYSFFNIIDKIKEQDISTSYSIGTIVYHTTFDMISQYDINCKYFSENYHLIKLIRKDIMAHFMSVVIFNATNFQHSSISSLTEINISIPYKPPITQLVTFMETRLEIERFKADTIIYYEDLLNNISTLKQNKYGLTPKEFFANYDEILNYFKQLNITHYER